MTGVDYTHPEVLTTGVTEGWADPQTDPARIDWPARQAAALIPFDVVDGRPLNPHAPTGIERGRGELGHWGECQAADAVVFAYHAGHWRMLMVERDDNHGWALPGGKLDPGEDALTAAIRELAEETGLVAGGARWKVLPVRYVPDPRATDEAWMVTTPAVTNLGTLTELPTVAGADDARRAEWVRADSYTTLVADLAATWHGKVFAAHDQMLRELLGERTGDDNSPLPAELLDISDDPEDCAACTAAHELWPRWPHGACPYHHGINHATDQIRTKLSELG